VAPTAPVAATPVEAQPAPAPAAPPSAVAQGYTPFAAPTPPADVITTLTAAGKFNTFLKAVDAAGLTATLKQPANFTVFAPPDAAFAALPAGVLDDLLKPENRTKLQHIVLYHVVNTPVTTAATLGHAAADIATVVPGSSPLTVHVDGSSGVLKINDAVVIQKDVKVSNGTVQVIDKVLMPAS
jgi:uncharacterized surface protein with fasciclin (FAS1) repeats